MRIHFYLRFHTQFGQSIAVVGNLPVLGNNDPAKAFPLRFFNEDLWHGSIELDAAQHSTVHYRYIFVNENGDIIKEIRTYSNNIKNGLFEIYEMYNSFIIKNYKDDILHGEFKSYYYNYLDNTIKIKERIYCAKRLRTWV